jgi:malonyl-CoA O-methyltransferase
VHTRALSRIVQRLEQADAAPWLHGEAARRMAERLALIKRTPIQVIDWESHRGGGSAALTQSCPRARIVRVEGHPRHLQAAAPAPWWRLQRARRGMPAVAAGTLAPFAADMLWSNMGLHLAPDPQALFTQWRRLIAAEGFLMFTTLGPGSLIELTAIYGQRGWGPALAPLVDMHDLGDMLVEAGFAEPVMDQELLTLTWADADTALAELRGLGGNAALERFPGLRGRAWKHDLVSALQSQRDAEGRVRLSFELVYGHAFCAAPRVRAGAESRFGLEEMRAMARQGNPGGRPKPLR